MSGIGLGDSDKGDHDAARVADGETARYLYCIVDADPMTGNLAVEGIDGNSVSIVRSSGIGVVVHRCESLYDSKNFDEVRRWLLAHQRVVDEAGDRFGTPLPFRFDTILIGDDEAVREWVDEHSEEIRAALEALADSWEYRIHLTWAPDALTDHVLEANADLEPPGEKGRKASEGTAFLKEKQFEQRLQTARQARKEALEQELAGRLHELTREVVTVDRPRVPAVEETDPAPFAGFAVLAHDDEVDALGNYLDDVAMLPGLEITYTGPWPPYSFAPTIGEES